MKPDFSKCFIRFFGLQLCHVYTVERKRANFGARALEVLSSCCKGQEMSHEGVYHPMRQGYFIQKHRTKSDVGPEYGTSNFKRATAVICRYRYT